MRKELWETVTNITCTHGEGPVWDEQENRIIWIDIEGKAIHEYYTEKDEVNTIALEQKPGAICLSQHNKMMAALEDGFAIINKEGAPATMVATTEKHLEGNRFNDGKAGPDGRFWAGSMALDGESKTACLYTLEKDFSVRVKIEDVTTSNGLAWHPNGKIFYYIDTATAKVVAYDYDNTSGDISNKRTVVTIPDDSGFPDGMTIDTEGMLWIALWGGWKVARFNPETGEQLEAFHLPVSQVSSCIFGGPQLNDLYITTARNDLSPMQLQKEPLAGSLFVIKNCGYQGLVTERFIQ